MKQQMLLQLLLPVLVATSPVSVGSIHQDSAPLLSSTAAAEIPGSYIVVFKEHVSPKGAEDHHTWVHTLHSEAENERAELRKRSSLDDWTDAVFGGLRHTYNSLDGFLGYSGHFHDDVVEQIRRHPDVAFVEKDSTVHTMGSSTTQNNAPWGLARISHRSRLNFGTFSKYIYDQDGGEGVDVYVIDTGTFVDHVDFEGRAHWGKTIPNNDVDDDGNGHGTHCSGTIAGTKYGVAKKAHVYAVKVLGSNGSGSMSDVISGVQFAVDSHKKKAAAAKATKDKKFKGSVANMSLGGGKSPALDMAVNAAVDNGLHFAVAAGNDNQDSCKYSPAAAEKAVTVGASTLSDERAYFSNVGKCNDIFAPGLNILSTWIGSQYATNTISGTSMASPHVAGMLAYFLSLQPSSDSAYAVDAVTPKQLKAQLIGLGSPNVLSDIPEDTINLLAFNAGGSTNFTAPAAHEIEHLHKGADMLDEIEELLEEEMERVKVKFESIMRNNGLEL